MTDADSRLALLPRPLRRYLPWYAMLEARLPTTSEDDDALVDDVMARGLRDPAFKLEGLHRLYEARFPRTMKGLLKRVKRLEDGLGRVDHWETMHAAAKERELPEAMVAWLDRERRSARKALARQLRKRGWVEDGRPVRAVRKQVRRLLGIDWGPEAEDRHWIGREMARQLREIEPAHYDMDDLERGIHELRRDLRWLPIILVALGDAAVLDDGPGPVPAWEALREAPIAASPFARLPEASPIADPIRISRSLYVANTKAIADLGELKDRGQLIEALTEACRESGVHADRQEARRFVLERLRLPESALEEILEAGRTLLAELEELGLIAHLRRQLRGEV